MQIKFSRILSILILVLCASQFSFSQTRRRPTPTSPPSNPTKLPEATKKRPVKIALRNGETINGDFIQATNDVMRVEIEGSLQTLNLADVLSIVFAESSTDASKNSRPVKLNPQAMVAVRDALKALRKMAGATEIGISFQEYGSRVIDAKADVEEALRQLPEGELKTEIGLAMDAYADASKAWNQMIRYDFMLVDFEPGSSLQKKYEIPIDTSLSSKMMRRTVVLSTIWGAAKSHIEKADALTN
jgi:hypothetical protein